MQRIARLLLITLAVVVSCVSIAMAAPTVTAAPVAASIQLTVDPFVASAEVSSSTPMAVRCPCSIFTGCGGLPVGYDCAEPAGCCHCYGTNPNTRLCVYNAR